MRLPPVPASASPDMKSFLESLKNALKDMESKSVTASALKKVGAITQEQEEELTKEGK